MHVLGKIKISCASVRITWAVAVCVYGYPPVQEGGHMGEGALPSREVEGSLSRGRRAAM